MDTNINKTAAVDFLEMVIAGKIDEAYEKYVDMSGKHHNLHTPTGLEAFREGMKSADSQFPDATFVVQHVLGEGDLVAVHSHLTLNEKMDFAAVHLIRFENGKIVEFWDIAQDIPAESPNTDGPF